MATDSNMINPDQYGGMLEINVTDDCNLSCSHCNRCCGVAPSRDYMPVSDIEKMCSEVDHMKRICISGGEPMLHPYICDIVGIIKDADIADEILLLTNGTVCADIHARLVAEYGITGLNSGKDTKPPEHTLLMTVSPADLNLFGAKGLFDCDILKRCGLGYSTDGYYPCVLSAAIGRVFGIPGVHNWRDFSNDSYIELLNATCRHCGYYLTSKCNTILPEFKYPPEMMTVSWRDAIYH